jgi:anhydro-N-acetylmuramic acid kinase
MPLAVGLMSGTSLDGVDAALIDSDGQRLLRPRAFHSAAYDEAFRERLRRLIDGREEAEAVARELTLRHAAAVAELLEQAKVSAQEVRIIGFHGQTISHRPDQGRTWQIGDGALLAAETGIDVVDDFRSADMVAGGQGAPLAPLYHAARARDLAKPLAVLNLGGVGNLTWIGGAGEEDLLAFDTGPGNAMIDDWMRRHAGLACDRDGRQALAGRVDRDALARLLDHPYFAAPPPKSLDRNDFDPAAVAGLSIADGAATLTAFTAAAVALALPHLPAKPQRWILCGGGRKNQAIIKCLSENLKVSIEQVEAVGWNGDALEAEAFAYLALRHLAGLPLSLPGTTGCARPCPGGRLHAA